MTAALDVGEGARAMIREGGTGTVIARYAKAVYVRRDGDVLALTAPQVHPGPLHLRCRRTPPYEVGRRVPLAELDTGAPTWRGTLPGPKAVAAAVGFALTLLAEVPPATLFEGPVPEAWPGHADALRAGDLRTAAETLGGRGAGLTPAGDDVLAGLILAARALWGPEEELQTVAARPRTNVVAAGFLRWAGRGQSIAPVHDFFHAVTRFDTPAAQAALASLREFGASSGTDLAYGLALALRHLPR